MIKRILTVVLVFSAFHLIAQAGEISILEQAREFTLDEMNKISTAIFGALTMIVTYFSDKIPWLNKLNETIFRAVAVALALGAGFVLFDAASALEVLIGFTFSQSFYDTILKGIFKVKSPDPEQPD